MQRKEEIKYLADPSGSGLNADDADFSIGQNEIINGENVRWGSTDAGVINVIESTGSTVLLSPVQPSVTFIDIGSVADTPKNRIYYFLYNQYTPDHKIMCWDDNLNRFYTVLLSIQVTGGLNFNKDFPIHSISVVGDLLYWTDGNVSQKRINVEAAIRMNHPEYDSGVAAYTNSVNQAVITLIRRPPSRALSVAVGTDAGRPNFLKLFAGQFAIQYIYRDGEESPPSIPSDFTDYRLEIANPSGVISDTSNYLTVGISAPAVDGEFIDQDVQKVRYLVRYGNTQQYFVAEEWDKNNPTDAAEIAAYNAGGSLSFLFYNDKKGIALSEAQSIKAGDSVPVASEGLEVRDNRLFLANNVSGYDTPAITSLVAAAAPQTGSSTGAKIFKSYSPYQVGIRFRDDYGRTSGVVTNNSLNVTIPDRSDFNDNLFCSGISISLSNANAVNEIPDYAVYADIMITKNLRTRFFVQWLPNDVQYVLKNNAGQYVYTGLFSGNLYGIAFNTQSLASQGFGQGVVFTPGDQVRVYVSGGSPAPINLEVIAQDANWVICRPYNFGSFPASLNILVEYYRPYVSSGDEFFYTTAIRILISNPGTSARQYATTSTSIQGDSYFVSRVTSVSATTYYTECMSPNDNKWMDWYRIYGQRGIITSLGQADKGTSLKWSNTYIPGTQTNGLSSFEPLHETLLPLEMGDIRKIINTSKIEAEGGVMLAIGEDETASVFTGEVQSYTSDQQKNQVLAVENVVGTVNILRGNFGTKNPESVTEYRGNVFWFDATNGRIIQYSVNGLFPISNYKMTRFWKLFSHQYNNMTNSQIEALGNRPFVFMTVDPYHDELLISIPKLLNTPPKGYLPDYPSTIYPFDVWDGQGKTMVFDLKSNPNKWMPVQTFVAENFITLQNKLFSFKEGQLYIHNQVSTYNQIYGVQNKSRVMFVCNQQPEDPKAYDSVSVETNTGNLFPSLFYIYADNPYVQTSDLVDFDWKNYEGVLYSTFYRNKIIPTAIGYSTDGLLVGQKVRTNVLKCLVEFSVTTIPLQLRFIKIIYILSSGHPHKK